MISYAFVDGFTRIAREEAIERLKRAIADADGVIVDFAFFAREAIRMSVELPASAMAVLKSKLEEQSVELFPRSAKNLDAASTMTASHPVVAMLHVAFLPKDEVAPVFA